MRGFLALTGVLALATGVLGAAPAHAAGPPPKTPLEAPPEFECMTSPTDAAVATTYRRFVDTFSMEVVNSGDKDSAFKAVLQGEGARCAALHGWDTEQTDLALGYMAGRLMGAGLWNASTLEPDELDRLRDALEDMSVTDLELVVGFIQLRDSSPSANNVLANMMIELFEKAEIEMDAEKGGEVGGMIAALAMSSLSIRKFNEVSEADETQEGEE